MKKTTAASTIWLLLCVPLLSFAQNVPKQVLTIERMFEIADSSSKSLKVHELAREMASREVRIAREAKLPSVDLSVSASYRGNAWIADRDFSNGTSAAMPHFGNNFAAEASQLIYAGGALTNGVRMAKLKEKAAELDKEGSRQELRLLLAGCYLELFKLSNQAEIYRKNIELTEQMIGNLKARQREGIALTNDITRYELQQQTLRQSLTQVENSRSVISNRMAIILDLPRDRAIEVDTLLAKRLPAIESEALWQQRGASSYIPLRQADLGIELAQRNEKIAKAALYPSVALFAGNKLDGPILIEVPPINKNLNYWYVGVGVKFSITSAYRSGSRSRLASLQSAQAGEQRLLVADMLQDEVKSAYTDLTEAVTIYTTQLKSRELAQQNYEIVSNRYRNDLAIITEMLDADNALLSANLQVANSRISILFCYFKLKKLTGSL